MLGDDSNSTHIFLLYNYNSLRLQDQIGNTTLIYSEQKNNNCNRMLCTVVLDSYILKITQKLFFYSTDGTYKNRYKVYKLFLPTNLGRSTLGSIKVGTGVCSVGLCLDAASICWIHISGDGV